MNRLCCHTRWLLLIAIFIIAGCATVQRPGGTKDPENSSFAGRISLVVESEPVQSFSGGFELLGSETAGQLTLLTPLGGTAAVLRWQPGLAQLQNGSDTRQYPSVQAMLEQTTGAAIPLEALFAWLRGQSASVPGWQADLSRHGEGRVSASRSDPTPVAKLRIVLER